MKGKASMSTKLASMAKTVGSAGGALDGGRVSKLGKCLGTGVAEPLMPKRRRGRCKESGGRR
jgi:hypothetical protein